jgi:hypothetical protein
MRIISKHRKKAETTLFLITIIAFAIVYASSTVLAPVPPPGSLIWEKSFVSIFAEYHDRPIAVDDTGVYIVGYDNKKGNERWRIEKRSLSNGRLIWLKTSNPSSDSDRANSVAVDESGLYIVGYDQKLGIERWIIEKRSLTDGSLIWIKTKNPIEANAPLEAYSVAVYESDIYIAGYASIEPEDERSWVEKRSTVDGSLIWWEHRLDGDYNIAHGVAVDVSGVYITGPWKPDIMTMSWRIEKRYH